MKKIYFLLWLLSGITLSVMAQPGFIAAGYQGMPFSEWTKKVEETSPYRFFYKKVWIDSLTLTLPTGAATLADVLDATLPKAGLRYWISPEQAVILLSGDPLQAVLPLPPTATAKLAVMAAAEETELLARKSRAAESNTLIKPLAEVGANGKLLGGKAVVSGYVRDIATGEPIAGAGVIVEALRLGVNTDANGYYALSLPPGSHTLLYRSFGKAQISQPVRLLGAGVLNQEMEDVVRDLEEVVIEAERNRNVQDVQMGVVSVSMKTIKEIPTLLGEIDVVKSALLLPGVQTVGEGAAGFNVRGGAADQNLVMIQQAVVFNPVHLFGFFSAFNPDVISQFELFKSSVPARYGGRLASVFDIGMKDGNRKTFSGSGGISPITARLSLEGPLGKKRSSFVAGGRSTYSDWLLNRLPDPGLRNSSADFYDLIGKVNLEPDANNRIDISAYVSRDRFTLNADTAFQYANQAATLAWKHLFNPKFYGVASAIYSRYAFGVGATAQEASAFQLDYQIQQRELRTDFTWLPSLRHKTHFGFGIINYALNPGEIRPGSESSLLAARKLEQENALETAFYFDEEWTPNQRMSLYAGLRYSLYAAFGERTLFQYAEGFPRELANLTDTVKTRPGQVYQTYQGPELRLAFRYNLGTNTSLKLSYNRMRQYLHRITNTAAIAPTDTWKLSDQHIRPQVGDQFAVGLFRNFRQNSIEASVEAYFKPSRNLVDFKGGAVLLMNERLETDLLQGDGRAYGVELLLRKNTGRLNGWIGYTWSRALMQVNGAFPEERINEGRWFPANQDKPHDFTSVVNYHLSRRFSASGTFTYSTGRPITFPVARYEFANGVRVFYSDRNAYRIPDYIRTDFAFNMEGNHRIKKLAHSSLSFSVYNLFGRRNVYSIYFITNNGRLEGYQLSIFGRPFPTLTYNFRF